MNLTQIKDEAERRYPETEKGLFTVTGHENKQHAFISGANYALETLKPKCKTVWEWVKASDELPLHLAFWNIEEGFKKDCGFPVRIGELYGIGRIYNEQKEGELVPRYCIAVDGIDYFAGEFVNIEWLRPLTILEPESEAVRFVEWIAKNGYEYSDNETGYFWFDGIIAGDEVNKLNNGEGYTEPTHYTTAQLYQIFIKQQSK